MRTASAVERQAATFAANRTRGTIALAVAAAGGRSRRKRIYEDGSLRVRFPNGDDLEAVIVNTAGGMAGGDAFSIDIAAGEGARLAVTTAAAEKVYRSIGDDTVLDVKLSVGTGGHLTWLPQETILFDQARLVRSIDVELAADGSVLMAEAVVFGRTAMGESVQRGHLFDRWRVRRDGKLLFADTMRLDGAIADKLGQAAVASGACAIASVLVAPAGDAVISGVRTVTDLSGEVGISAWNGFALARLVAHDGDALRRDLKRVLAALGTPLPRLWHS